jgi:hypothetical protein
MTASRREDVDVVVTEVGNWALVGDPRGRTGARESKRRRQLRLYYMPGDAQAQCWLIQTQAGSGRSTVLNQPIQAAIDRVDAKAPL